ncbi:unnamed protein product [Adineta ricciae]|uniref:t-SNARE coiled-coil homology domain-containing protein n=1 Tax=Adineta ricciae TaxID=249248 RepID=A0A815CF02_ADIRI|nr:unnamed protein product [Adineta ricciae]
MTTISLSKNKFDIVIKDLEDTLERSQTLASQVTQMNSLQTKQIDRFQTNMDKSSRHLEEIEHEMDELQKGFCIRLCCPSKCGKSKSKSSTSEKVDDYHSNKYVIPIEQNLIYSNDKFQSLDEHLQRLQYFNTLIDHELQDQLQALNDLNEQVDTNAYKLTKVNKKGRSLFPN